MVTESSDESEVVRDSSSGTKREAQRCGQQTLGKLLLSAFTDISVSALKVMLKNPSKRSKEGVTVGRSCEDSIDVRMEYLASLSGLWITLKA